MFSAMFGSEAKLIVRKNFVYYEIFVYLYVNFFFKDFGNAI